MSYTHEEMKKLYDDLTKESENWHTIAANWKGTAEDATAILREIQWIPAFNASGSYYQCPECHAYKGDGHQGNCALWAVLTTGRRQRPQASSDSELPEGYTVSEVEGEGERMIVAWSSYDELLTAYMRLARERLLVNVLCIVSSLVALIVLAVQVYNVLGRGYW